MQAGRQPLDVYIMSKAPEDPTASISVSGDPRGELVVRGTLPQRPDDAKLYYAAPSPVDRRASFSGSGLPYASRDQAFVGTPNRGVAEVGGIGNAFELRLDSPSAYYEGLGTVLVPPALHLAYVIGGVEMRSQVPLARPVPFRTLSYQAQRKDAMFYAPESPLLRTQEAILRASAFPTANAQPADFWGGRPAR